MLIFENEIDAAGFLVALKKLPEEVFVGLIFKRHNLRRSLLTLSLSDSSLITHEQAVGLILADRHRFQKGLREQLVRFLDGPDLGLTDAGLPSRLPRDGP